MYSASTQLFTSLTKYLSVFLLLFYCACTEKKKENDCSAVRTGKFFLPSKYGIPAFTIRREDSVSLEINEETKSERIYSIRWIDSCSYEMRLIDRTGDKDTLSQSALRDSLEKIPSIVRILNVTDTYYLFEINKVGISMPYSDTLWIKH